MERNKVHLGDVCKVVSGSTPKTGIPEYWNGDIKWITPAEIQEDSFYIYDSVRHITLLGKEKTGLSYMPKGTVILSSRAPIGKTAITGCEMCCNQGFKNLICSDKIFNEYLYYFLKGKEKYLNSLGRGATFKEISKKIVEDIEIPLPNIKEQKHIATVLGCIDRVISLRQQQLAKLDELVKARFVEMFGKYENGTTTVFMEDVSEMITVGIANSATHAYAENGVIMFRNQNIKEGFLDDSDLIYITEEFASKYKTKQLKENDLLITRTGYPGIACIVPKKYEGTQTFTTLIVRLKNSGRVMACYACNYINSYYGKRYVESMKAGVAQQNFGAKALDKMPIFIPPMDEQIAFENFVERSYRTKLILLKGLEQMETLKKALMQQYFG